ncbi:GNAT family N-acetyltransferase [soil metagenome]
MAGTLLSMGAIDVRAADERDRDLIAELIGELGYDVDQDRLGERLQAASAVGNVVLVATVDERVVGIISAAIVPMLAEADAMMRITALSVTASMRGRGVGRALMSAVERQARQLGADVVEVGSGRRPERLAAHRFYQALGYVDADPTATRFWKWFTPTSASR